MARQMKRAGDVTGRRAAELAAERQAEVEARQNEISLVNAQASQRAEETVDLTDGPQSQPLAEPRVVEEADQDKVADPDPAPASRGNDVEVVEEPDIEVTDVEVAPKIVEFRVNEDLENVTIGQGTNYNFFEGTKYRAPKHIYDHLEEKGYIWH